MFKNEIATAESGTAGGTSSATGDATGTCVSGDAQQDVSLATPMPVVAAGRTLSEEEARAMAARGAPLVAGHVVTTGSPAVVPAETAQSITTSSSSSSDGGSSEGSATMSATSADVSPRGGGVGGCAEGSTATAELHLEAGTYIGDVHPVTRRRQGRGTMYYKSGNVYDGEWKDDLADGVGEKRYANGDVYRGRWVQGVRGGHGSYLFKDGHYFEGMYANDQPNGYGVLTTVTGDRYAGSWRNGKKDGKGRETLQNGQIFVGSWREDMRQGRGKLLMPGAAEYIYGVWNRDVFFRELTREEMQQNGAEDVVDEYGMPRDLTAPQRATVPDTAEMSAADTTPTETSWLQDLTGSIADRVISGLAALGGALEGVTVEGGDVDDVAQGHSLQQTGDRDEQELLPTLGEP